jgi:hypothetical protein
MYYCRELKEEAPLLLDLVVFMHTAGTTPWESYLAVDQHQIRDLMSAADFDQISNPGSVRSHAVHEIFDCWLHTPPMGANLRPD